MAFNISTNRAARTTYQDDSWKAAGFLNLSLPTKAGGRAKLFGIPLKASNPNHARLIASLEKDPAKTLTWILENVEIDFRSAEPSEDNAFAI